MARSYIARALRGSSSSACFQASTASSRSPSRQRLSELHVGGDELRGHLGKLLPHEYRAVPQPAEPIEREAESREVRARSRGRARWRARQPRSPLRRPPRPDRARSAARGRSHRTHRPQAPRSTQRPRADAALAPEPFGEHERDVRALTAPPQTLGSRFDQPQRALGPADDALRAHCTRPHSSAANGPPQTSSATLVRSAAENISRTRPTSADASAVSAKTMTIGAPVSSARSRKTAGRTSVPRSTTRWPASASAPAMIALLMLWPSPCMVPDDHGDPGVAGRGRRGHEARTCSATTAELVNAYSSRSPRAHAAPSSETAGANSWSKRRSCSMPEARVVSMTAIASPASLARNAW